MIKAGPGEVILDNANTYQGSTTINNGILDIQNSQALGPAAGGQSITINYNTLLSQEGTLQLDDGGSGNGIDVTNQTLYVYGTGSPLAAGTVVNAVGNNVWAGDVVFENGSYASPSTIAVDGSTFLTISGISGAAVGTPAVTSGRRRALDQNRVGDAGFHHRQRLHHRHQRLDGHPRN